VDLIAEEDLPCGGRVLEESIALPAVDSSTAGSAVEAFPAVEKSFYSSSL
jgi:hypothetical protein